VSNTIRETSKRRSWLDPGWSAIGKNGDSVSIYKLRCTMLPFNLVLNYRVLVEILRLEIGDFYRCRK
jgi:hypothetical protein